MVGIITKGITQDVERRVDSFRVKYGKENPTDLTVTEDVVVGEGKAGGTVSKD